MTHNLPKRDAPIKEWARYYHTLGLHPVPVRPGSKFPSVKWTEYQTRQPSLEEIEKWEWVGGVGIVTTNLIVVDCDKGGERLLKPEDLPVSWTVQTGGGGLHRHYSGDGHPRRNTVRILKGDNGAGVDIRADGGFIIMPPTRHSKTHKPYWWKLPPEVVPLAPAPAWILEAVREPEPAAVPDRPVIDGGDAFKRARAYLAKIPGAIEGQGGDNHTFITACKILRGFGLTEEKAFDLMLEWNATCQPPWTKKELRKKVHNAWSYGDEPIGQRRDTEKPRAPTRGAKEHKTPTAATVAMLSDIQSEAVTWAWPSRVPRGKLSLIIGDPGLGKSLTCLDLAARITTGGLWPDGTRAPQGNVVLLTAEDGLADTVRPRLDALGGNPDHVHVLRAIREDEAERGFTLTSDLAHLESLMVEINAVAAFLDPISAYMGTTDSYRDSEVRSVLAPLAAIAERTGAAIIGVMHLTKNQQRQLIHRVQGNVAFAAAARAVFAVAEDRDTPDRRFFVCVKMNLARKPPSLAFRIEEADQVPVIKWEQAIVDVDVNTLFGPPESEEYRGAREQAVEFLREMLSDGPVNSDAVWTEAKKERISRNTLKRAKGVLGVVSRKADFMGGWTWELPVAKRPKDPIQR